MKVSILVYSQNWQQLIITQSIEKSQKYYKKDSLYLTLIKDKILNKIYPDFELKQKA